MAYEPMKSSYLLKDPIYYLVHAKIGLINSQLSVVSYNVFGKHPGQNPSQVENVDDFIKNLGDQKTYPPAGYNTKAFKGPKIATPPGTKFELAIPLRGMARVVVELIDGLTLAYDGTATNNPVEAEVLPQDEAYLGGVRYVDSPAANPSISQYCPTNCSMFYFGINKPLRAKTNYGIKVKLHPSRRGPDTVYPDVPNDGGKPVPPGRR